jgi:small subunit ribosomal protein S1
MFEKLTPGQEIETTIVQISGDTIFIDLNAKSEGVISSAEFADADGNISVKAGDKIKAFYLGEKNGENRFTTKIAGQSADDSMLENAFKNHIPVEGHVEKEIKGGFEVTVGSSRAFCPYSQMGFRQKEEPAYFIGKTLTFIIQEYKDGGKKLVVSNRKVLEEEHQNQLSGLSKKIAVGSIVTGTVKSLQSFGAFVDVDGFQALLPISEISLDRVTDISKVLEVGQEVTAKVISTDWDKERVSISTKALIKSPWETVNEHFSKGQKIDGKISRVTDFGVFINLESGIDGLVHISALGVDRNTNLKKKFSVGQPMSVVIKEIDAANRRISLVPSTSNEQDEEASEYFSTHNDSDGETYNPFAALLKK